MKQHILTVLGYIVATFATQATSHFMLFAQHYAAVPYIKSPPIFALSFLTMIIQGSVMSFVFAASRFSGKSLVHAVMFAWLFGAFHVSYIALGEAAKYAVPSVPSWIAVEVLARALCNLLSLVSSLALLTVDEWPFDGKETRKARNPIWVQKAEEIFNFAKTARFRFENGPTEEKRAILSDLGSNLVLKDKKLIISIEKPLSFIEEAAKEVKAIHAGFEPQEILRNKRTLAEIYSQSPTLLPCHNAIITILSDQTYMQNLYEQFRFIQHIQVQALGDERAA